MCTSLFKKTNNEAHVGYKDKLLDYALNLRALRQ